MSAGSSYPAPYANGISTPTLKLPPQPSTATQHSPIAPAHTPPVMGNPQTPGGSTQYYSNAMLAPYPQNSPAVATPGTMGPPSKPERKEYQYDVDDALAGTGIDLREEEQNLVEYFGSAASGPVTGLPANTPGNKASFYGAGIANQQAMTLTEQDQTAATLQLAKKAWQDSAKALATQRLHELKDPFLAGNVLHYKAEKIAKEHGLTLNLDARNVGNLGKMMRESEFPRPRVTVKTAVGPDGAMVVTTGSYLPEDSYLADQLALLNIAAKHRIRDLLEDANKIAVTRQQSAHGGVPDEWKDVAVPVRAETAPAEEESSRIGNESAVSPRTNPLKRMYRHPTCHHVISNTRQDP
jgi:hypothetical protein